MSTTPKNQTPTADLVAALAELDNVKANKVNPGFKNPRSGSVTIRLFNVPPDPSGSTPYTRVNHAKFMVTGHTLTHTHTHTHTLTPTHTQHMTHTRTRPSHPHVIVAEQQAFISTSNWSGDYFIRCRWSHVTCV